MESRMTANVHVESDATIEGNILGGTPACKQRFTVIKVGPADLMGMTPDQLRRLAEEATRTADRRDEELSEEQGASGNGDGNG